MDAAREFFLTYNCKRPIDEDSVLGWQGRTGCSRLHTATGLQYCNMPNTCWMRDQVREIVRHRAAKVRTYILTMGPEKSMLSNLTVYQIKNKECAFSAVALVIDNRSLHPPRTGFVYLPAG